MTYHAGKLADWLVKQIPNIGSISRKQIKQILHEKRLTEYQIEQIVLIAINRGQIINEYGGATLRRVK